MDRSSKDFSSPAIWNVLLELFINYKNIKIEIFHANFTEKQRNMQSVCIKFKNYPKQLCYPFLSATSVTLQ